MKRALVLLVLPLLAWAAPGGADEGAWCTYRGLFFEIQYPAGFRAHNLDAATEAESNAATFASPDGAVEFYVFSPQWAGEAPGIAFDPSKEVEVTRSSAPGDNGVYSWFTYRARDGSYTRSYQDFSDPALNVHWVIGLRYARDEDYIRYAVLYEAFKHSLKQFAD